jgi:glycosyltransferase involved in cell wall biosynthesis
LAGNLRIYIAISNFLPLVGGAEKQALAQARSLRERGYETTIITLRHDKVWPRREMIDSVPVIRVAGILLADRERLPQLLKKLVYLMGLLVLGWTLWHHRRRYDILHVYQLNLLALPTALACRLSNKPMIIAVRSTSTINTGRSESNASLLAESNGTTVPSPRVDGQREVGGDLAPLEALGKPVVRFTRSLLQSIHAMVIVLSSRMESYLAAHGFSLPGTRLIPNGVDISRFTPLWEDSSLEERAQVVVCISKLRYEKGIDVLLQAWHLLQEQLPRPSRTRLIIVGDGPLQSQLEHLAMTLGIADNVEFTGLQSDVQAQFHRGSLAVLPSRWEGMPNALLEAMACGMACVATRVSGSEDIIQHGVNGLLVEPGDYQGMAQALLTLLRDHALAQEYGKAARETVEKYYAFEHITDMYVELYLRIAADRYSIIKDKSASEMYHLPF